MSIAVFVKKEINNAIKMRNDFLKCIGGKSHVLCSHHDVPLMSSYDKGFPCVQRRNNAICKNKLSHCCPHFNCRIGSCKRCFNNCSETEITRIELNFDEIVDYNSDYGLESASSEDSSINAVESQDISIANNENDILRALDSREDALNDFILAPNEIEDEVIEETRYDAMPTINAGECQMTIEE